MRTLYDSVSVADIPANATLVAGYVDGKYANMPAIRQRFPHATRVEITVTGLTLNAIVADCETGDLTPVSAAAWARRKIAAGQHPTIYCNSSTWAAVKVEVGKLGIARQVSYWIAHYDGDPTIPVGAVAKQYRSTTRPNLDYSVVADYWPGVDPLPKVTTSKAPAKAPVKASAKAAPKPVAKPAPKPAVKTLTPAQRARAAFLHRCHLDHLHVAHLLHLAALLRRRKFH